jgi:hypothetical protein
MKNWFFLLLGALVLLMGASPNSWAYNNERACNRLAPYDNEAYRSCLRTAQAMELSPGFIKSCADFHSRQDIRVRCVQTGATEAVFDQCAKGRYSVEGSLACMTASGNTALMRACRGVSPKEEDQLRCVQLGRPQDRVSACNETFGLPEHRLTCVEMNVPAAQARACSLALQEANSRFACMRQVMAENGLDRGDLALRPRQRGGRAPASVTHWSEEVRWPYNLDQQRTSE